MYIDVWRADVIKVDGKLGYFDDWKGIFKNNWVKERRSWQGIPETLVILVISSSCGSVNNNKGLLLKLFQSALCVRSVKKNHWRRTD